MKLLVLGIIIFLSSPEMVKATSCKDLKSELLERNEALLTHKGPTGCGTPDLVCTNLEQAQSEYNEILAKLRLTQGLIAIGASVDVTNEAITNVQKIETATISTISDDVDSFLFSFNRANLLQQAIGFDLWTDYTGTTQGEMQLHLEKLCQGTTQEAFCGELKKIKDESFFNYSEIIKTFHGFHQADTKINHIDKTEDYKDYADYLNIQINDNTVDMNSYKDNGSIKKVLALKDAITKYQENPTDNDLAKTIIEKSKDVRPIDVTFDKSVSISQSHQEVTQLFDKEIGKTFQYIYSGANKFLYIDRTSKKIDRDIQRMQDQLGYSTSAAHQTLKAYVEANKITDCSTIELNCLDLICTTKTTCDQKGLRDLFEQKERIAQTKQMITSFEAVQKCYKEDETKKDLPLLKECLTKAKDAIGISSSQEELQKKLEEKKKEIDGLEADAAIKEAREKLLYSYLVYKKIGCEAKKSEYTECDTCSKKEYIDGILNQSAIHLGNTLNDVLIHLRPNGFSQEQETEFLQKWAKIDETSKTTEYLVEYAKNNPITVSPNTNPEVQNKINTNTNISVRQQRRNRREPWTEERRQSFSNNLSAGLIRAGGEIFSAVQFTNYNQQRLDMTYNYWDNWINYAPSYYSTPDMYYFTYDLPTTQQYNNWYYSPVSSPYNNFTFNSIGTYTPQDYSYTNTSDVYSFNFDV